MKRKPVGRKPVLKKARDVERLSFSMAGGRPVLIGGHYHGRVFAGRLKFRDGTTKQVAIKVFRVPLNDAEAKRYQRAINALRKAGIALPKMAMVKTPAHGWVQVSQLFGSVSGGSKVVNKSNLVIKSRAGRTQAVKQLTRVANAGYPPMIDLIEPFKGPRKGSIPIDIDSVVIHMHNFRAPSREMRANFIAEAIETMAAYSGGLNEAGRLWGIAIETASPGIRKALEEINPFE